MIEDFILRQLMVYIIKQLLLEILLPKLVSMTINNWNHIYLNYTFYQVVQCFKQYLTMLPAFSFVFIDCNTALSKPSFRLALSNISLSYEFLVISLYTLTDLSWPILWHLAWAWRSFWGFQSESNMMTVSAAVKLIPKPPARVQRRKTNLWKIISVFMKFHTGWNTIHHRILRRAMELEVEGTRSVFRPKKTWNKVVEEDMRKLNIIEHMTI